MGYVDGLSLYRAYFAPNRLDPSGNHNIATDTKVRVDDGGGASYRPRTDSDWQTTPVDPLFMQNNWVATATATLAWPSAGEKCGEPIILTLVINSGGVRTTNDYFDNNDQDFITRPTSQGQLTPAQGGGANTFTFSWTIPTRCVTGSSNDCEIDWSSDGYKIEYSPNGNSPMINNAGGDPVWPRGSNNQPTWFEGVILKPEVTLHVYDECCLISQDSGSVTIERFGRSPNDPVNNTGN